MRGYKKDKKRKVSLEIKINVGNRWWIRKQLTRRFWNRKKSFKEIKCGNKKGLEKWK